MRVVALCAGVFAVLLAPAAAVADEFLALPGLWKTTYEVQGVATAPGDPKVVWHCVDEAADPWASFAQLRDLPGMTCTRSSLEYKSTSLKWKTECHGPGPADNADMIRSEGAIVFDSSQHYTGWVKISGSLMGYPVQSGSKVEGSRHAACTSPSD
jgi:hypothetical protein